MPCAAPPCPLRTVRIHLQEAGVGDAGVAAACSRTRPAKSGDWSERRVLSIASSHPYDRFVSIISRCRRSS